MNPVDILRSRRTDVTEPYFSSIPIEERNSVKYLLSDMYNPYLTYVRNISPMQFQSLILFMSSSG